MKIDMDTTGTVEIPRADTLSCLRRKVTRLEKEIRVLRQFAYRDALTGLPNRRLLQDRINQAISRAARSDEQIALLFIDLDGFKEINDRFGHCVGDKLLQSVAQRLLSCIREADSVCRYGGDEFVILLPSVSNKNSAKKLAEKIQSRLSDIYFLEELAIGMTASIGLALYLETSHGYLDLIRQADLAMYMAKARAHTELGINTSAVRTDS